MGSFNAQKAFATDEWLKECYQKRCAVMFTCNQKGVDLLIPVKVGDAFTFILVQVKNRLTMPTMDRFESAGIGLCPNECFNITWTKDYLALYMEVGSYNQSHDLSILTDKNVALFKAHLKTYRNHLMLLGFDSMKISADEELLPVFKFFCRRHVENLNESARGRILSKMVPLVHGFSEKCCACTKGCTGRCGCLADGVACKEWCKCQLKGYNCGNTATREMMEGIDADAGTNAGGANAGRNPAG